MRSAVAAMVQIPGRTTVSAKKLSEVVRELDAQAEVELRQEGGFLHLRSGSARFRLTVTPADDFPSLQLGDGGNVVSLPGDRLARMIGVTSFAMSSDETRKYLTGTLFDCDGALLRLVTTDGHRLALAEETLGEEREKRQCIVPRKAVLEMRKMAEEAEGAVELRLDERQIRFACGNNLLASKLIDARFPVYQDVVPSDNPEQLLLDRLAFDQVLRRAMIVANEFTHDVRLELDASSLLVSAHNTEQEEVSEAIAGDFTGGRLTIGFNGRYLRDALSVIGAGSVCMKLRDGLSPVLITAVGDESMRFVIMPMRI